MNVLVTPGTVVRRSRAGRALAVLALGLGLAVAARGAVRFDVFVGYDGVVPEASWFPVVCEIENTGPSFNAVVEFSAGYQSQARLMAVELPSGTTKRFTMPVFSTGRYNYQWQARLLDERRKVRAETQATQKQRDWGIPLAGAMTRAGGGMPVLPEAKANNLNAQLKVARLLPDLFPDNPIALEGLSTIYLNPARALELKVGQVNALVAWLHGGGHLIVGVESVTDVAGNEWLRRLLPCEVSGVTTLAAHRELQEWVRSAKSADGREVSRIDLSPTTPEGRKKAGKVSNPFGELAADEAFEQKPLTLVTGALRDGRVWIGPEASPLGITAWRGRGQITMLTFSPEREPFLSWKNRPHFWAKLTAVPAEVLTAEQYNRQAWQSLDGVFGAMIDSKQVRKLPVGWLLLLLVAYLLVIGPLDQFWLKKMNRQMLTWVTFPAYVACFSVLIYFIGYKLRAGETEWNELHVVDVMAFGERADWRGHTYASLYSPVNAKYPLATDVAVATLRGEFLGNGGQEASKATVAQKGNSFEAEISVPVWTSQLYVGEWWRQDATPLRVAVTDSGTQWNVEVENRLDVKVTQAKLVVQGQVLDVGDVPAGETKRLQLAKRGGATLRAFSQMHAGNFGGAVSRRQAAFGDNQVQIENVPLSAMAASFVSQSSPDRPNQHSGNHPFSGGFVTTPGQELTELVERGDAVLLAWAAGHAPVKPMHQFSPRRVHRDTLFRVGAAIKN